MNTGQRIETGGNGEAWVGVVWRDFYISDEESEQDG